MRKKYTSFITAFLRNNGSRELVDKWLSAEVQEKWLKMYATNSNQKKKRCSCYILFCLDKREGLKTAKPKKSPAEITSILAAQWRKHKEANDETYRYYKKMDHKRAFCEKTKTKLYTKYPDLSEEELAVLVEKMYAKMSGEG